MTATHSKTAIRAKIRAFSGILLLFPSKIRALSPKESGSWRPRATQAAAARPRRGEERGSWRPRAARPAAARPRRGDGRGSWLRGDRATASIELAILTPSVIAVFASVVMAGRLTLAHQASDAAAYDAARTASLARSAEAAQTQARAAALASFTSQGIDCVTLEVTVSTAGFSVPVGQPATVSATVTCDAALDDLALPGLSMPGSVTLTSSFVSPLDRYRSRS